MNFKIENICESVARRERLSRGEAEWLWQNASDDELARLATQVRGRFHPNNEATYLIMCIINYTNVCVARCDYCSFYRLPHEDGTYLLSYDQIRQRIDALLKLNGTMIGFNGGFHPKLRLEDYAQMFAKIRRDYGERLEFYGMTVAEFMFACRVSKLTYDDGAALLRAHGSNWVTGGGAEILDDQFRKRHSPGKYLVEDYFAAQRAIIQSGMNSTATMVIGFDESAEERFNHLERLRVFQDETFGTMPSFLCWTYKPYHNRLGGEEISTREYLRWLAICRIFLDNFVHIRTSVLTKNQDALRGLAYGANDFDLPTEDEVTQKAGATISLEFDQLLTSVHNLGFQPKLRRPFELTVTTPAS